MDQLSRRLHHYTPPGRPGGVFFCLFFTILKLMRRYRSVLGLDPCDAAYIAGLIDGEGTITLSREHRNENRRLVVSIASTERCLLEFVADRTGCGKITNKRTTSEPHTLSFAFRVTNRQALELLRQVRPYLRSYKAARAALALKHYLVLTPRNGQYTTGQTRARQEFETFFLRLRKTAHSATTKLRPPTV
ncbi:MAG TPA: LAGLIDADG family homing endonuclease [Candidatus Acidoferrales bacterium]|nr:LAGLIDADG family homing endonuclease [Candidatus Acidoferrales bacterium]